MLRSLRTNRSEIVTPTSDDLVRPERTRTRLYICASDLVASSSIDRLTLPASVASQPAPTCCARTLRTTRSAPQAVDRAVDSPQRSPQRSPQPLRLLSLRTDRVQGSRSGRTPLRSRKLAASSSAACQGFAQPANLQPRHARRRSASAGLRQARSRPHSE